MDLPYQFPEPGQYGVDHRERSQSSSSLYGGYNTDASSIIGSASEQMLSQNGFYLRLQYTSTKQKEENDTLRQTNAELVKENELLKERNQTYSEIVDRSMAKDPQMAPPPSAGSKKRSRIFSLTNPPPVPKLPERGDNPDTNYWLFSQFRTHVKDAKKGETDGNATEPKVKGKVGRPPKSLIDDPDDHSKHFYLEHHDGTPVSKDTIVNLSRSARMIWEGFLIEEIAPLSLGKMTKIAWDFYWRSMAADPEFYFLLLCDGGEWKLRQWSSDSYSGWARNRGVRQVKPKVEALNDPKLIKLDPVDDWIGDKESPPPDTKDVGNDITQAPDPAFEDNNEDPRPHPPIKPIAGPSTALSSVIADHFAPVLKPSVPAGSKHQENPSFAF